MKIILKENIQKLGYKNDTVEVKPGYGRNYLIPRGMAIIASASNKKMIDENIRQVAHKAEKSKKDAQEFAKQIGDISLEIKTKAGEKGKIFGAITPIQIAEALGTKGHKIDRKLISFKEKIKELGEYSVVLNLHKEIQHEITINVVVD